MKVSSYVLVLFAILVIASPQLFQNAHAVEIPHYFEKNEDCVDTIVDGIVDGDTILEITDSGEFDFISGRKYLVIAEGKYASDDLSGGVGYEVSIGGTVWTNSTSWLEPPSTASSLCQSTNGWQSYLWFGIFTSDGTDTVALRIQDGTGGSAYDNYALFVMEISEDLTENTDWYYDKGGSATIGTIPSFSTSDDASVTFTPDSATTKYLTLFSQQLDVSDITSTFCSRIKVDSVDVGIDICQEGEDANELYINTFSHVGTYSVASHTNEIEAGYSTGTGGTRTGSQVFVLNLDKFQSSAYSYDSTADALTGSFSTQETIEHTPQTDGDDHLIFVEAGKWQTVSELVGSRLQYEANNGTMVDSFFNMTSSPTPLARQNGATKSVPFSWFTVENLNTNPHTINFDNYETGAEVTVEWSSLFAFSMTLNATVTAVPDQPTLGNATTISTSRINLLWTDTSNSTETPDGYYIERESPVGGGWSNIATTTNATTSYNNTGLTSNTEYNYRIKGYNIIGNSTVSSAFSNTTIADPPTGLATFSRSTTQIDLEWIAPSGNGVITGYKIEYENPLGAGWSVLETDTGDNLTYYNHTGLTADTQYNYRLYAINEGGTSAVSSSQSGGTYGSPTPPSSLTVSGGELSGYDLDLAWSVGGENGYPIIGYKIDRKLEGGAWSTLVNDTGSTSLTYTDTSVSELEKYHYRIGTWNTFGNSTTYSPEIWNVTFADPTYNLFLMPHLRTSVNQLNLTWNYPDNPQPATTPTAIEGFKIEREVPVGGGWGTLIANTTGDCESGDEYFARDCSYEDTGLSINNYYNYRVSALLANPSGGSFEMSPSGSYSTTTYNLPNAVDVLTAVASGDFISIVLDWDQPATLYGYLQGYMINYTTPQGDPQTIYLNHTSSSGTAYEATGLSVGDEYSFRVSAVTLHGWNSTGLIANASLFSTYDIGSLDTSPPVTSAFPITFEQDSVDDDTTNVMVKYDSSYNLACDLEYRFARTNQTYTGLTENPHPDGGSRVYTNFTLNNPDNEIIDIYCWDQLNNSTDGQYRLSQTSGAIPIFTQIDQFQNGVFGTDGQFGALDLMTLFVVIISMIGFNRYNPAVGVVLMVAVLGVLSFYQVIQIPTLIMGIIALVVALAITTVKKP